MKQQKSGMDLRSIKKDSYQKDNPLLPFAADE